MLGESQEAATTPARVSAYQDALGCRIKLQPSARPGAARRRARVDSTTAAEGHPRKKAQANHRHAWEEGTSCRNPHAATIRPQPQLPATYSAALATVSDDVIHPVLTTVRAPDDLTLARRCVAGDRSAQRALFQRDVRRVHATLYRILGSNGSIDDLVQESFLEIFRSLKNFRGEASLATWIDRCTVRVAYAYLSNKRKHLPLLEIVSEIPSGDPNAEERAIARQAAHRLYEELERLGPEQRLAFTLHAIDGRRLDEVAQLMEATLVATKSRVWRARQALEKRARHDPLLAGFLGPATPRKEGGA
jgi:RNA polymerase sigma-70 factor (ECF subfamily)